MSTIFGSEFFTANRARLRELFTGTAPIVISANGAMQRNSDLVYPFHQDSNFWYLTGIDEPDVILVMDKGKEYLILPIRDEKRATFDGHIATEDILRTSGIAAAVDMKEGWRQLSSRLKKVKHVATISAPPRYIESYGMYTNPARARLIRQLKDQNSAVELLDISEHLVRLRMIKQSQELAAIRQAVAITIDSMKAATKFARRQKYSHEYEIEAEIIRGFRARGASGHAFDPIIASGKNATTIHYLSNNSSLATDEMVVIDVGAAYDHYAADITRTVPVGKDMTRRQSQVFNAVVEVQTYAYEQLRPGVLIKEYENAIEHFMGEKLRELGLIKTIDSEQVRKYYPHATSHHLGLNVHDVADYERPLEAGMVITVEPGIYIPDESLGIRIEDDVIITDTGIDIITSSLPIQLS